MTTSEPITELETESPPPAALAAYDGLVEEEAFDRSLDDTQSIRPPRRDRDEKRARPAHPRRVPAAVDKTPQVQKEITNENDKALKDWLMGMGDPAHIQIIVKRVTPTTYQGVATEGVLAHYDEPIDEERLKEEHGGGTFEITVKRRGDKGGFQYFQSRRVKIAGVPKLDNLLNATDRSAAAPAAPPPAHDPLAVRAFDMMANTTRELTAKYDRAMNERATSSGSGDVATVIAAATAPLQATIAKLERALEIATGPKEPTMAERAESKLLDKLIDQDSARIAALKADHERELRMVKENAREDEKRAQAVFDRERDRLERDATNRITELKVLHEVTLQTVRSSLELQLTMANKENDRLQREVESIRKDLNDLRAKKEKSPIELIKEMGELKDALTDDDDEDDKSKGGTIERLVGRLVDSDIAKGVAKRVMTMGEQQGGGGFPVGIPFINPADGVMYINNGQQVVPYRRKKKKVKEGGSREAGGAEAAASEEKREKKAKKKDRLQIDKESVKMAVGMLETAYRGGQDPETVAESARSMVPADVNRYVSKHGVDALLDEVAGLEASSPLAQQAGRIWVRKVAKRLLGDVD